MDSYCASLLLLLLIPLIIVKNCIKSKMLKQESEGIRKDSWLCNNLGGI